VGEVLERVASTTGMELVLDGSVRGTRLTAEIEALPVSLALERLLEGSNVRYAMSLSPDGQAVSRMFVGTEARVRSAASPPAMDGGALLRALAKRTPASLPGLRPASVADEDDEADAELDDGSLPFPGIPREAIPGILQSGLPLRGTASASPVAARPEQKPPSDVNH